MGQCWFLNGCSEANCLWHEYLPTFYIIIGQLTETAVYVMRQLGSSLLECTLIYLKLLCSFLFIAQLISFEVSSFLSCIQIICDLYKILCSQLVLKFIRLFQIEYYFQIVFLYYSVSQVSQNLAPPQLSWVLQHPTLNQQPISRHRGRSDDLLRPPHQNFL